MKRKKLNQNIVEGLCKKLYSLGLNTHAIATEMGMELKEVESILGTDTFDERYPVAKDESAIEAILGGEMDSDVLEAFVIDENKRVRVYSAIESKCVDIMAKLLDYYSDIEPGDIKVDSFKAKLANDFIRATQEVRNELLARFAINKQSDNKGDKIIDIEFI